MTSELRIQVDSTADTKGIDRTADALDDLADQADQTKKSTKGLGDEVDKTTTKTEGLGRKSRKTSEDVRTLDGRIVQLKSDLKTLGAELERDSGNKNLLAKFRSDSNELKGLQRTRKEISGLTDDVKDLGKAGGAAASTFTSLFQGGAINFLKSPVGATIGGTAAVGTAVGVGAIAGGAITAGVGAGVAGAGIAGAAMQSKAVQDEWAKTTSEIKKQFLDATTGYEQPAIAAIKRIGGAIKDDIDMKAIFGNAEKFVEPLADSTAKALVSIGHGFESLTANAEPAIVALSNGIQDLGDATGVALEQIGDGSEGGAKALGDFLGVASDLIMLTGAWIGFFEDTYDVVTDTAEGMRHLNPLFGLMAEGVDKLSGKGPVVSQLSGELDRAAAAARGAYGSFEDLSAGMYNTADAARELDGRFNALFSTELRQDEANLAVKAGWIELNKELLEGKRTLDQNTEAGQANVQSIFEQIRKLAEKRDADIAAGNGTLEATETANRAYAGQIEMLRRTLLQMGFNIAEVDKLIEKYYQIPAEINTNINTYHNDYYARQGAGGTAFDPGARDARRGLAGGTSYWRGGWTMVGEKGPELVELPTGSKVHTADSTSRMLAGTGTNSAAPPALGGGGAVTVRLVVAPGADSALGSLLMKMAQTGDLGFVLAS